MQLPHLVPMVIVPFPSGREGKGRGDLVPMVIAPSPSDVNVFAVFILFEKAVLFEETYQFYLR